MYAKNAIGTVFQISQNHCLQNIIKTYLKFSNNTTAFVNKFILKTHGVIQSK